MDQAKLARMQASVRIGYVSSVQNCFHPDLSIPSMEENEISNCNTRIRHSPIVRLRISHPRIHATAAISQISNPNMNIV
ncbi:hypothetical protein ACN38_g4977 [Penicillium nordicum]|uniref:Uncharacterized protein n=1 Tax=Penicillium nordicum TaxID=229535 RepID=A0A0M8PB56_9EURO|nr:hypothetical protein ACN38_g4977 [Penicillium nordicum]